MVLHPRPFYCSALRKDGLISFAYVVFNQLFPQELIYTDSFRHGHSILQPLYRRNAANF